MTLFEEIVLNSGLLTELRQGNDNNIISAINDMKCARIVYHDGENDRKGKGERYIFPVAYGLSKANNPVVRAFEYYGSSKRGLKTPPNNRLYPKWKLFRLDRIVSWATEKRKVNPEQMKSQLQGLNDNGDDSMVEIYALSPICNTDGINFSDPHGATINITSGPIKKTDVEPTQKETSTEEPNKQITTSYIDNSEKESHINDKLEAQGTKPITKQEVEGVPSTSTETQQSIDSDNIELANSAETTDEPITKQEVEPEEEEQTDDFVKKFKDLSSRMNDVEKNNREEFRI